MDETFTTSVGEDEILNQERSQEILGDFYLLERDNGSRISKDDLKRRQIIGIMTGADVEDEDRRGPVPEEFKSVFSGERWTMSLPTSKYEERSGVLRICHVYVCNYGKDTGQEVYYKTLENKNPDRKLKRKILIEEQNGKEWRDRQARGSFGGMAPPSDNGIQGKSQFIEIDEFDNGKIRLRGWESKGVGIINHTSPCSIRERKEQMREIPPKKLVSYTKSLSYEMLYQKKEPFFTKLRNSINIRRK